MPSEPPSRDKAPTDTGMEGSRRLGRDLREKRSNGRPFIPRNESQPPVRRHIAASRWPRRTLIVANIAVATTILVAIGGYGYVRWRLGQINRIAVHGLGTPPSQSSAGPFTLLVIGSDSRSIANGSQFGQASGSAAVEGQRSDSIIVIRVNPKARSLALLSIPRDTVVPVPGYGTTRINTAFNTGNPSLLVQVLSQDFGITVDHVASFTFDSFEQVANAVGGVEQYFPSAARDVVDGLTIPQAGCYNLSGIQALQFVRSREYEYYLNGRWHYQLYPESDLARIQRQQAFIKDVAKKAKKVAPTNLIELNSIVGSITKNLTLDSGFTDSLLLSLAQDFRSANLSLIPSYTYPVTNIPGTGELRANVQQGTGTVQQWLAVGTTTPTSPSSVTPISPPTTTVLPSSVAISVENGSGIGGQATAAGSALSSLGYKTTISGDSPSFGLAVSEIEYAPDSLIAAKQLQSQLLGGANLVEASALTPTPFNLRLITGQSYRGAIGASGSEHQQPTTTIVGSPAYVGTQTVNPDSSSIYNGVYIPAGLVPAQVPQTCGE